jgi:membrane protease YdiL (CAAX protease family)
MHTELRTGLRDRVGMLLQNPIIASLELLVVPLLLGLHAIGVFPKPKLPLLLFGWFSMWLRRVGWSQLGLSRPPDWLKTLGAATLIAIAYDLLDISLILPALHRLTGEPLDLAAFASVKGNTGMLMLLIAASWISAAFPEEMLYRGYILNRLTDIFGKRRTGWIVSAILVCLVFGFAHHAQGITGILDNVIAGGLFVALYFAVRRNLWLPILVHGMIDTISVILLYFGFYP